MDLSEIGFETNRHPWEISRKECILKICHKIVTNFDSKEKIDIVDIGAGDLYFANSLLEQEAKVSSYLKGNKMKLNSKQFFMQFIKFGIVGMSNTFVFLAIYYLVLCLDGRLYLIGNLAGWIISVLNAFFWNNKYVFGGKSANSVILLKRICKTYLSYSLTFLLSSGLLYLEVNVLDCSVAISPMINLLVTIPLNFLLNKFWAFR